MSKHGKIVFLLSAIILIVILSILYSVHRNPSRDSSGDSLDTVTLSTKEETPLTTIEPKDIPEYQFLGDTTGGHCLRVSESTVESTGIESVFFFDITGDSIPEIWLLTDDCEAEKRLLVYSLSEWGKELLNTYAGHTSFYAGTNYVIMVEAHMGKAVWYQLKWNGKKILIRKTYQESIAGLSDDYRTPSEKWIDPMPPSTVAPDDCLLMQN